MLSEDLGISISDAQLRDAEKLKRDKVVLKNKCEHDWQPTHMFNICSKCGANDY